MSICLCGATASTEVEIQEGFSANFCESCLNHILNSEPVRIIIQEKEKRPKS